MNTNVASFFYITQQAIPHMKAKFWAGGKHLRGFRRSTEQRRARTTGRALEVANASRE
jgi:hypothetical protein